LRDFIFGLYLQYPELRDKIEALTLVNDPVALTRVLRKRITSLKRGRRFIDYRASFDFARELEAILADIESGLLECSPEHAFELVDRFLATAESVLNRVDDSGGAVGEVYRQAVLVWLTAAKAWRDANINWLERIDQLYQQNDYGVLDPLLPNAHLLLTADQLKQLARHQQLAECFYDGLLRLAKAFEKADCNLAATACYRALLLDILAQARSKAYGHGVRYYKKLEASAKQIKVFKPLPTHDAFVQQLQSDHGRKKSFWARLES